MALEPGELGAEFVAQREQRGRQLGVDAPRLVERRTDVDKVLPLRDPVVRQGVGPLAEASCPIKAVKVKSSSNVAGTVPGCPLRLKLRLKL